MSDTETPKTVPVRRRKSRWLKIPKALFAGLLIIGIGYSAGGLLGFFETPIVPWSQWWHHASLLPGLGQDFEDHLLSAVAFGGLLLAWPWRAGRRT